MASRQEAATGNRLPPAMVNLEQEQAMANSQVVMANLMEGGPRVK